MELNSIHAKTSTRITLQQVKCGICRNEIRRGASIYQEGITFGVVCEDCYKSNSPEDIELMANLFLAFGGYFGQYKSEKYSLYESLKNYIEPGKNKKKVDTLNIQLMHNALLHGITPHQYIQSLKILSE
jgi:hypothetical protein